MAEGFVDNLLTPPGEADGFTLVENHESFEILPLLSATSTTPIDEYEHLSPIPTTSSRPSLRAHAATMLNPPTTDTSPLLIPDCASASSVVYYSSPSISPSTSSSSSSSSCSEEEDYEEADEKTNPPLLLSTERIEEQLEIEGECKPEQPTQYTVAELLNLIIERGIELPDTDDEEGFEAEGGMGGLEEEEVLREIEIWERERAEGKAVDGNFTTGGASALHSPTSIYSFDEHATTTLTTAPHAPPTPNQRKNPHPATNTPNTSALTALSTQLARNEHVVDAQKVLREWDEAEARGEGYDMSGRVKTLQNGKAGDCGALVDGLGGLLRG